MFRSIYQAYNRKLRESRQIDFDDMLLFTWELFKERKDILLAWQKRFKYILIDEFQDINRVQYEIIRMLAAPENNLFIVGDDDQSIYRFRGAKPEIMLGFTKDYPQARTIILDINYRCTQEIVESALRVIKNNKARFEKNLRAFHEGGEPVEIKVFNTMGEEYDTLIKEIYQYHTKEKKPLKNLAVLYRTNTGARQLVAKLMEYNIPSVCGIQCQICLNTGSPGIFLLILKQPWDRGTAAIICGSSTGQNVIFPARCFPRRCPWRS